MEIVLFILLFCSTIAASDKRGWHAMAHWTFNVVLLAATVAVWLVSEGRL